jgi:hypothetical protein
LLGVDPRSPEHWAVSCARAIVEAALPARVLVQLGDAAGEQVRVAMTAQQARALAAALLLQATAAEEDAARACTTDASR